MTFTEAAIDVLRREGKPLHFKKIAEIAIRDNLLDHVGKIPEETMGGQLAAHCRLPRPERTVVPVQPGTFALVEWGLEEDPHGLDGIVEPPPEDDLPYRPRERHPIPSRDLARSLSRDGGRGRRREEGEERRGKRFPPPAEVAYEILAGAERPLGLSEIAALGAERFLMPDAFVRDVESLAAALREDNRRRESAGRRPLFAVEGDSVTLAAQPEPGERPAAPAPPVHVAGAAEMRRTALAALRRRLRECDAPTVEHVVTRLLEKTGFREVKVAKRGREQVVYTGRRRMGLGDVRHCVRIVRTGADVGRREVVEVRRDLGHYGAQIGVIVSAGDAGRDARGEASAAGHQPVLLLCGEALAEAFTDACVGVAAVVIPEIEEAFFQSAAEAASREEAARRARREERDRRERAEAEGAPASAEVPAAAGGEGTAEGGFPPAEAAGDADEEEGGGDGEDEADEAEASVGEAGPQLQGPAAGAAQGEGRRRRRRRRRRGGRGRGERGERRPAGEGPAPGVDAGGAAAQPAETPPSPPAPSSGGGEGTS